MALKGKKLQSSDGKDIASFEKLFKRYYAELVKYAYGFTKDIDASEEIVQDFFYNYWKDRKRIIIKFSLKAYLYRAVRNNSLNYLESVRVRRKYAEKVLTMSKNMAGYEDRGMEYGELSKVIEDALDELPERCSTIFKMSRFDGLKYEEIAVKLSISVKTVEANIGKALRLLRERIENYNKPDVGKRSF